MRVATLLPSATEMCYALGVEPVAVSESCDYPAATADLPTVTASRIDSNADSAEINEQVAAAQEDGEGVYSIRRSVLRDVDPDLLITQGVCEVCAVDDRLVRDTVSELDLDAEVISIHPHSLADVLEAIELIGERTGRADEASTVIGALQARIQAVRDRTPPSDTRVLVTDWMEPVMVAGHWIPEMVEIAGGSYDMAEPGERSRPREFEDICAYDPEVLVVAPCGFSLEETLANIEDITARPGYASIAAVREGRVYAMDGHHYVNRPGPRLVDTLEYLGGILHPESMELPPDDVARRVPHVDTPAD